MSKNKTPTLTKPQLQKKYDDLLLKWTVSKNDSTLSQYHILSSLYKTGKMLNNNYTIATLCVHTDLPRTTIKRILSLDRANKRTWDLIKRDKISSFRVCEIILQKGWKNQDKVIDLVLKDNLTSRQIKGLKISSSGDIKKEKLRIAVEQGYSKKSSAFTNFFHTVERMITLLDMKKEDFPEDKLEILEDKLEVLERKIGEFRVKIKSK